MKTNLSEDVIPITELIHNTQQVLQQLRNNKRPLLITQHGRAAMVCMEVVEYQEQIKKMKIIDEILHGERALSAGKVRDWDSFAKDLLNKKK